ncbi:MAG: class I tRNA ligase family protein, partial [bacterium]|nr:class I tRNA ligase family protein [bacterium]
WECEKCQNREVFGSLAEIKERSGKEVTDLHRPHIDTIIFPCQKCDGKMKRVKEVLDCWMESGSMPYGERHYPFENKEDFEKGFPADYISEYSGQVRAWFYVLHVLSGALFGSSCFKNVVVSGVIMGTDGRKMSKSFNNFPDPKKIIETYGGDALRLYLMGSPTMAGQDMNVSEEAIREQAKNILLILWNCYNFFVTHASLKTVNSEQLTVNSRNLLDRWILSRVHNFLNNFTESLDAYHIPETVRLVPVFLDDLSRWYIRRSRDRFEVGDEEALATLYRVLILFSKTAAPLIPFIAEEIYQNLDRQKESVHLEDWPAADKKTIDKEIEDKMALVRKICETGHAKRKELGLKVRQPLSKVRIHNIEKVLDEEYQSLIAAELNVKEVDFAVGKGETEVEFDTKLTSSLIAEGEAREIVRSVQEERKKENCAINEKIILTLPSWPKEFESYIMKKTLAEKIKKGEALEIKRH